jgi:hypothetical protein
MSRNVAVDVARTVVEPSFVTPACTRPALVYCNVQQRFEFGAALPLLITTLVAPTCFRLRLAQAPKEIEPPLAGTKAELTDASYAAASVVE